MLNRKKKKRLGIFVTYDKEGIIDDYITFLLHSIKPYLSEMVIVCNGFLQKEEYNKLYFFTDKIFLRENNGYDIASWKMIILQYIEENKIQKFDEIILFNDSFYGPIFSFGEVFEKMDSQNIDFWGLTKHPESYEIGRGEIPEHIQSYFIGIRSRLFFSEDFKKYWEDIDISNKNLLDAILQHELFFTSNFSMKGYTWCTYIDAKELESKNINKNYNQYYLSPLELIVNYRYPIIKKKALSDKNLQAVYGEQPLEVINYVSENTNYNCNLIWQNLIRKFSKSKLYESFHLHFPLSTKISSRKVLLKKKFLLYIVGEKDDAKIIDENVLSMDVVWKKENFELDKINPKQISGYDFVGKIYLASHDDKLAYLHQWEIVWNNMFENASYLQGVCELFEKYSFLGIVYPLRADEPMEMNSFEKESFWCRTEYIQYPDKYLYGTISTEKHCALRVKQNGQIIDNILKKEEVPDIFNKKDVFKNPKLLEYINQLDSIYVYGTGIYGRRMIEILRENGKEAKSFVVSDGQSLNKVIDMDVMTFSELQQSVEWNSKTGLIIALSKKVQQEIANIIRESEISNIFFL